MTTRREKIEAMLASEPHDQFLRYGLACEYETEGRFEEAAKVFHSLMNDPEPHIASFLRGAQLLVRMDEIEQARAALRTGIELARSQGKMHPAGEMAELLMTLGSMGE
jgi:hypothetical protein